MLNYGFLLISKQNIFVKLQNTTFYKTQIRNNEELKNIIEKTLLPYQFDAMNLVARGLSQIMITKDTIAGKSPAIMIFDKTVNEQK